MGESATSGAPGAPRRRVPLAMVLAIALVVLAAGAGYGIVLATRHRAPHPAGRAAPSHPPGSGVPASAAPGTLPPGTLAPGTDPCLIGTWTATSYRLTNQIDNTAVEFVGGAGMTQTFRGDGTAAQNFGPAAPLTATVHGANWREIVQGSATLRYQARAGVLVYEGGSISGTWRLAGDGAPSTGGPLSISLQPVRYTCAGDTLDQDGGGYTIRSTRTGR